MLKKLGAILLALLLVVSLAACGTTEPEPIDPAEQAFETYSYIMERMSFGPNHTGAYDIDFTMQMDMTFDDETISTVVSGNMKMIVEGEDTAEVSMIMELSDGWDTFTAELYMAIEDGELTAARFAIDGEEFPEDLLAQDMLQDIVDDAFDVPDVDFEAFTSVEIEEVDGNTVMHIVLDGQMLRDFVLESMDEQIGALADMEMEIVIEDVLMTIVTDSDYNPLSMTMEMSMHMEFEGEAFSMDMISEFVFNGFDDNVEIFV
ncbi:MAG: hypothetical protein FWE08_07345 [Oscillospiraceae bacterium]|nr:hypothetical protein [Oscillospiraceae bacterium]